MKLKASSKSGGKVAGFGVKDLPKTSIHPLPVFHLKKILVPVDFSDCSNKAMVYAAALARQFGAEVTLLHVVSPYMPIPDMVTVDLAAMQKEIQASAKKQLKELNQTVTDDVKRHVALRTGEPHREIVAAAKELGVDLIIISTHGRTGLAHVFMGSTAERVVRHAGCPVLIVREKEHEFLGGRLN